MKTLKITLALAALLLLTVSGVKSEDVAVNDENPTYKGQTNYDLLAHNKKKLEVQSKG
jgi:hypothetical protein